MTAARFRNFRASYNGHTDLFTMRYTSEVLIRGCVDSARLSTWSSKPQASGASENSEVSVE